MIEREYWYDLYEDNEGNYFTVGANLESDGSYEDSTDEDQSIIVNREPTFCDWIILDADDKKVNPMATSVSLAEVEKCFLNVYWSEVTW